MGTVWLAERSDGRFERRATVKFLSVALVGRGEERFKREGILARLVHPHIAQLIDAGVSTSGQPYPVQAKTAEKTWHASGRSTSCRGSQG